ncbi:MAG: hypothetical protein PVF58_12755 [Candidatus Methanofastidiosia archaeon]|jgi:phenylacetate-CoA ligase
MTLRDIYYFTKLWRNPKKSVKDIKKYQVKKLKEVVHHAYQNSPFYHRKFKNAGVTPSDIHTLDDISKIPYTTKEELRQAGPDVLARNIPLDRCYSSMTSGTSGKKLDMYHSFTFRSFCVAIFYRMFIEWGVKPFKTVTYIRYTPIDYSHAKLGMITSHHISSFLDVEKQMDALCHQNPDILVAHPPDLVALAQIAQKLDTCITFDFIGSNSELLTQKERDFIEKTFECPVYNEYSSLEVGYMARDCTLKHMHIISDSAFLEIVKDGEQVNPGERGEVVATSLCLDVTPFIRYRHRDVASFSDEQCECGINFPLMQIIEGRQDQFIVLPSGKEIPPTRIVPLFFGMKSVKDFAVVQTSKKNIVVEVVPYNSGLHQKDKEDIHEKIQKALPGMDIEIDTVLSIEKTERGKKRTVSNLVGKQKGGTII